MGDCVFCKIVAGEIPSTKVYEDDDVLAFMDIAPIVRGHVLVIPRKHYNPITDTPDETLAKIIAVVKKVAKAQVGSLHADAINVTQANGRLAGQVIDHVHFHVIPRFNDDEHSWNMPQGRYDDDKEAAELAESIKKGLTDVS
jgi:histidine triad (HIT) family protein